MSVTFINRTSRVAIEARIAQLRRVSQCSSELMILGDYQAPFGKTEARAEARKWLCQV